MKDIGQPGHQCRQGCYGLTDYARRCSYEQPWPVGFATCAKFDPTENCIPISATDHEIETKGYIPIQLPTRVAARYRAAFDAFRAELNAISEEIKKGPA